MLRARIYINEEEIDDIQIVNTGKKYEGFRNTVKATEYKVNDDYYVYHRREDGWEVLLMKVLEVKNQLEREQFLYIC